MKATKKASPELDERSAKQKALETAIKQLEQDFGEGTIMKLGANKHMSVQAVSTGSSCACSCISLRSLSASAATSGCVISWVISSYRPSIQRSLSCIPVISVSYDHAG